MENNDTHLPTVCVSESKWMKRLRALARAQRTAGGGGLEIAPCLPQCPAKSLESLISLLYLVDGDGPKHKSTYLLPPPASQVLREQPLEANRAGSVAVLDNR